MPTFSSYPSSRVEVADIPGAIQRGREGAQINQLRQTKIQSGIAEQGRLNQLRAVMPGVGAEAGLGEKAQQALGLDPALLGKFMEMSKDKRAQIKQTIERVANLLAPFADPGVAPIQKAQMWPKMLQRAQAMGLPLDEVPQQFDPQWVMMEMAEAGQHKDMLDRAEQAAPPTGYRRTEADGVELRPGYLEGQEALAAAKRGPDGGGSLTALQKDVPYIAKLLGISNKEALALKIESKGKGYDAYLRDIMARYVSTSERPERAYEMAKAVADLAYDRAKPPEADPDSEEGQNWLQELFGFGGSGTAAKPKARAAPRRRGLMGKAGAAGKGGQANPHMPETQADFDAIPSGEIYTDPDDKKLYRKP